MTGSSLRPLLAIAGTVFALAIAAPASAAKFTITVDDANSCAGTWQTTGPANSPTITCVLTAPPPAGAPTCNITPSQTVSANTTVTLALANCNAPSGGALTYAWYAGTVSSQPLVTTATFTTTPTATTTYYAVVTADGLSTTYSTTVTVSTVTPPPSANSCAGYTAINMGDLSFDGTDHISTGVSGSAVAYARIVVPNPLPAGWFGKTAQVSVFQYIDGSQWRKAYLSKSPCDFTLVSQYSANQGSSVNLYMSFGADAYGAVTMQPGDVWYLNVKDENRNGTPSCASGQSCNFDVRLYPPGG